MEPVSTPMEKRIRMVRAWLDAAAKSYATKGSVKGNFHLFLAQAEMKQMNEGRPSIVTYFQRILWGLVAVGILGATQWWMSHDSTPKVVDTPVVQRSVDTAPVTESPPVLPTTPSEQPESNKVESVSEPARATPVSQPVAEPTHAPSISSQDMLHAVQAGGRILRD